MKFRNLVELNSGWLWDTRLIIHCEGSSYELDTCEAVEEFGDRRVLVFYNNVVVLI